MVTQWFECGRIIDITVIGWNETGAASQLWQHVAYKSALCVRIRT